MTNEPKRVISTSSTPESERVPEQGDMPRVSDTLINATGAPDADYHAEALANAVVDNEAGTKPDDEIGGIVPLKSGKDASEAPAGAADPADTLAVVDEKSGP